MIPSLPLRVADAWRTRLGGHGADACLPPPFIRARDHGRPWLAAWAHGYEDPDGQPAVALNVKTGRLVYTVAFLVSHWQRNGTTEGETR